MSVFLKDGLEEIQSTICLCCEDDYGDIAEECFVSGVCEDCMDTYSSEELIEIVLE
jgi:hypothetical protein